MAPLKNLAPLALVVSSMVALLSAGEVSPIQDPPCEEPPFCGSLTAGYDTAYLFRGGRYGDNAPWSEVDLNVSLSGNVSLNFGTWYINPTKKNALVSDELDLYAYLVYSFESPVIGAWDVEVGGAWFEYLEDDDDGSELSVTLTTPVAGWFDLSFEYVYDLTYRGHYFGYSAEKCIPLREWVDLDLAAGISHGDDHYNYEALGGDNVYVKAGATFHLTDAMDFGAYLLQNWPFADLAAAGEESDLYGGAFVSVLF